MSLKLENVMKVYDKTILQDVNCEFTRGVYALLGPNGAGKSTMLKAICDIEPITSGKILYDEKPIASLGKSYRDILGYVPQKVGYYPEFTADEFLEYMSVVKGIPEQDRKTRINEVMELVNLTNTGNKKIKNFSGGMKQRLGIAQAILNHPKLLILDEPTAGLDVKERMNLKEFISEYASERIVLFATHIVSDIEDIGTEILILKDGTIKAQASPEKLRELIQDKVWIIECDISEMSVYKKKYRISNTKMNGNKIELRVLSIQKPEENAISAEGNLQDLYVFLFEQVN